jgi:transposase
VKKATKSQHDRARRLRRATAIELVELGLTRAEVARELGVHRCTVQGWTTGIVPNWQKPPERLTTPRAQVIWQAIQHDRTRVRTAAVKLLEDKYRRMLDEIEDEVAT